MKSNAPEKLYISYKGYGVFSDDGSTERTNISQIEYVRTDVFIEKAAEYLKEHLIDYWSQGVTDESKFVEEFRKYMEE